MDSIQLAETFAALKEWIDRSAYPALIHGPLKSEPDVTSIYSELSKLEEEVRRSRAIPIALVGLTGVGKSTLLNALLQEEFLPVGVIGSQTAAFVTIAYSPKWQVTCQYIDKVDLERLFRDARSEVDEATESGSPELRERAQRRVRALLEMKEDEPLTPATLRDGPPSRLRDIVALEQQRFVGDDWKTQLELHAKRCFWPITRAIEVVGPFKTLEQGVVISDLPGTGDLNRARADQADAAIQEAGQLLIAADTRLLQTSVMDQLVGAGRLPHRLFRTNERLQVVIIGTSLDTRLPDPEDDPGQVRELGLDPATASTEDIFAAVSTRWRESIHPLFRSWLRERADQLLSERSEEERDLRVAAIMEHVKVVATCAKDAERLRLGRRMKSCRVEADTGLPQLRHLINDLARDQKRTTIGRLEQRLRELRAMVLSAIERSERMLGANIEVIQLAVDRSNQQVQEVQEKQVQIVENLRLSFLERFQQNRETLRDKIQNASLRMRNVGRSQVQEHLNGLHWRSLRATVDSGNVGIWTTGAGRNVNLRDAMGGEMTRLVPQAWSMLADERIRNRTDNLRAQVATILQAFTVQIRHFVEGELTDVVSRRTVTILLDAALKGADATIEQSARRVTDLLGQTSKEMQKLVDKAVDLSLVEVCAACSADSGQGWTARSVQRIVEATTQVAEQAEQRCIDIADGAFERIEQSAIALCNAAVAEMESISGSLPTVLYNTQRTRMSAPLGFRDLLRNARTAAPRVGVRYEVNSVAG